jgi:hypothetical protein
MSPEHGLDGLFEPLSRCLDAESARRVVELQVAAPVQKRIDLLADRANEGTLSDSERSEYEALINASDFISILKLKARRYFESRDSLADGRDEVDLGPSPCRRVL